MARRHHYLLICSLSLSLSASLFADEPPAPPPPPAAPVPPSPERDRPRREQTPADRVERLSRQVPDLTAEQKAAILALYSAAADAMAATRADQDLTAEQREARYRQIQGETRGKIEAVLTEAQRAKWNETREQPAPPGNGGPNGPREESPNARILRRYESVLTDLSDAQKTQIVAIAEAARPQQDAIRNNQNLSGEQREAEMEKIRDAVTAETVKVFTEPQRTKWQAMLDDQRRREMERDMNLRPGETAEQKKVRVLKPYTDALPDLTDAQKAQLWEVAEGAADVIEDIQSDDSRTEEQKRAVVKRVNAATAKKVAAILTAAQLPRWEKAQAAPVPAAAAGK